MNEQLDNIELEERPTVANPEHMESDEARRLREFVARKWNEDL